jgi:hypothetical protein
MAKSKIFIVYDSTNMGFEDSIPIERFIKFSDKHSSYYIIVLVQSNLENNLVRQIIVKKYKYELFNLLKQTIIRGDYQLHVTEEYISKNSKDNFVYTRLICEFEPGFSPWIQAIEATNTFNDLHNIL